VKVAFRTLGCRLNQYDTESMKALVVAGLSVQMVAWQSEADVYVLNSCTVTGKADQECRRLARQVKRLHPQSKVVVTGCYAQTQSEHLTAIPEIDGIVGNSAKQSIGEWLPAIVQGQRLVQAEDFPRQLNFAAPLIDTFDGRARAYVKVQDGCDLRCTYCLIWQARGPARSRPVSDVLRQLDKLYRNGFREVVLAGIHLGHYGRDLQPRRSLADLLQDIIVEFPQLRLRLSSIHPNEVGPVLLTLWEKHKQLRPHLHLSLQSGSDSVLARMQRPYRSKAARRAVMNVANVVPHCGIGADLIVGFPGETDAEFQQTRDLVTDLPFTYLHVFRFSPRPGTPAASMQGVVHPETVTERSALLRDLARRKQLTFIERLQGQDREVVVEAAASESGWYQGTTDNYASVLIPGRWREGSVVRCRLRLDPAENILRAETVNTALHA
jgi:threonylcarbamoyladenosine tRNA methylthiotransferase MtaB